MSAVVTQPQAGDKHQQFPMVNAPPPTVNIPPGLPPGLAYLGAIEEVRVHQQLELLEVLVGWERNNKYQICNSADQQFMFAKEDTDCCTRQICGTARPFVMNLTDNQGQQLIQLHRPLRCQGSLCWCCFLQEMEIHSPAGVPIATIKEIWTCWTPRYKVYNMNGETMFTIVGDCCYCKCCADVIFKVFTGEDESVEAGQIVKHWGGCREVFGGANDFSLHFPSGIDVLSKAILLGSTFLIDFNYFEYRGNN